jgi:hypothetical protein
LFPRRLRFAIQPELSDSTKTPAGRLSIRLNGGWRMPTASVPGAWGQIPATDVALVDNATNYIEVSAAGAIVSNASAFCTPWPFPTAS